MPTFQEFLRVARITAKDKTSSRRLREIVSILRKHKVFKGFTPDKAVSVLQDLGPTYVKMGQIASNRPDLVPPDYCQAFQKLHANVSPMDFQTVTQCIDESYGHPWQEVFQSLEEKPLGSASIAQVHKGVLHDGTVVAVKVRRPGIVREMAEDMMLMNHALATAEFVTTRHESMLQNAEGFVSELSRTTSDELDFRVELGNLVRFREEIADQEGVSSPTPYPEFSNDSVLVMEFIKGVSIKDTDELRRQGLDVDALAERLAQSYINQVLTNGFFHADPHPGNIVVRNGDVVWLDLGMTGTLSSSERTLVGRVFRAVTTQNANECKDAILGLTQHPGEVQHGVILERVSNLLGSYATADLKDVNVGEIFEEVIDLMREQDLIVKPSVSMLVRGIVTLEGVLAEVSPATSIIDIVSKHVIRDSLSADSIMAKAFEMVTSTAESVEAITKLPSRTLSTMEMLQRGQIRVKADMKVADDALATIYATVGRLSLALIAVGLLLGSSILCTTTMEPRILGVPILGAIGFIVSVVLGFYVVVRTFIDRHKMVNHIKIE